VDQVRKYLGYSKARSVPGPIPSRERQFCPRAQRYRVAAPIHPSLSFNPRFQYSVDFARKELTDSRGNLVSIYRRYTHGIPAIHTERKRGDPKWM